MADESLGVLGLVAAPLLAGRHGRVAQCGAVVSAGSVGSAAVGCYAVYPQAWVVALSLLIGGPVWEGYR